MVVKKIEEVRREERLVFATILTALQKYGSKSRGDLERVTEQMMRCVFLTHLDLKTALKETLSDAAKSLLPSTEEK